MALDFHSITFLIQAKSRGDSFERALILGRAEVPVFAKGTQQDDCAAAWEGGRKPNLFERSGSCAGLLQLLRLMMNLHWPFWLRRCRHAWRSLVV